jgi:hypothetical protein
VVARVRASDRLLAAVVLGAVLIGGGWLRFSGADWDRGHHLHPDERYLSIVADNIHWPGSLGGYLDVHRSPLSPYNTQQGRSYVYGTFPLFATKAVAAAIGEDGYGRYYLVGRRLSALLDLGTVVLTFLLSRMLLYRLGRRRALWGALLAAALYAFTVTAVQLSHFATVESWVVFFGTLTLYLAARALARPVRADRRLELPWAAVGIALALTVACKVSGGVVAIAVGIAVLGRAAIAVQALGKSSAALRLAGAVLLVLVPGYLAYRFVSPYTFADSFWLDPGINPAYRAALRAQQDALNGAFLYPPAYQWLLSRPVWAPLENLVVWQLGTPLGVVAIAGVVLITGGLARQLGGLARDRYRLKRLNAAEIHSLSMRAMLLATALVLFFSVATLFAHTGRYLVSLAPLLAAAAAFALVVTLWSRRRVLLAAGGTLVALTAAYALAFHGIYDRTNTRVAASDWIVHHVSAGSTIANEHWDDSLPLGGDFAPYRGSTVPVFDADDATKLAKLYDALQPADYYVLSSPRAWRTIGRLRDRFPLMVRFYRDLFAGRLGFRRVASFRSVPSLLGLKLDDVGAEEAFWVYDHPPVSIFRHTRRLTLAEFRHVLCPPPQLEACA